MEQSPAAEPAAEPAVEPVPVAEPAPPSEPDSSASVAVPSEPVAVKPGASEPQASDGGLVEPPHSDPVGLAEPIPESPEPERPLNTPQERFSAFRHWLDEQGPRYEVWANDCIFIATNPPFLELEFPKGFRHSHVSASDRDELLLQGVERFFPDCSRVRVRNRSADSDRLTHRETVAKEAAEAQSALEKLIADHADIQSIAAHFDAAIRSVHKDHRAPLPPALSGEEGA